MTPKWAGRLWEGLPPGEAKATLPGAPDRVSLCLPGTTWLALCSVRLSCDSTSHLWSSRSPTGQGPQLLGEGGLGVSEEGLASFQWLLPAFWPSLAIPGGLVRAGHLTWEMARWAVKVAGTLQMRPATPSVTAGPTSVSRPRDSQSELLGVPWPVMLPTESLLTHVQNSDP